MEKLLHKRKKNVSISIRQTIVNFRKFATAHTPKSSNSLPPHYLQTFSTFVKAVFARFPRVGVDGLMKKVEQRENESEKKKAH